MSTSQRPALKPQMQIQLSPQTQRRSLATSVDFRTILLVIALKKIKGSIEPTHGSVGSDVRKLQSMVC